jgi:hypothetical protein
MKNSNDTIENRTRDLPACSAVPQPTAPPRAPLFVLVMIIECHIIYRSSLNVNHLYCVPPHILHFVVILLLLLLLT